MRLVVLTYCRQRSYITPKYFKVRANATLPGEVRSKWFNAGYGDSPILHPERLNPQEQLKLGDLYIRDLPSEDGDRVIQLWMYQRDPNGQTLGWKPVCDLTEVVHPSHHILRLSFTEKGTPHWIQQSTMRKGRGAQPRCWVPHCIAAYIHGC